MEKIKVVTAPEFMTDEDFENDEVYHFMFLAGGITGCPDWQKEIIELFNNRVVDDHKNDIRLFNHIEIYPVVIIRLPFTQRYTCIDCLSECMYFFVGWGVAGSSPSPFFVGGGCG